MTVQPASSYCRTNSRPMPRLAPVTSTVAMALLLSAAAELAAVIDPAGLVVPRRDFDLDLHPRVDHAGHDGRRRRPALGKMPAEDRGEAGEVRALGNDIGHPHHLIEPAAALLKRLLDVAEALLGSEEHTSELQSLMRISYAVFCLKKKKRIKHTPRISQFS